MLKIHEMVAFEVVRFSPSTYVHHSQAEFLRNTVPTELHDKVVQLMHSMTEL